MQSRDFIIKKFLQCKVTLSDFHSVIKTLLLFEHSNNLESVETFLEDTHILRIRISPNEGNSFSQNLWQNFKEWSV